MAEVDVVNNLLDMNNLAAQEHRYTHINVQNIILKFVQKNNQNCTNITHQVWKHAAQDLSESFEAEFWAQVLRPNINFATQERETVSKIEEHQSSSSRLRDWEKVRCLKKLR